MRKTSPYGEHREAAIVLLATKSLLRGCEHDLAIPSDGRGGIMYSVVDSKREHSLYPQLLSDAFSAVATAADQKSRQLPIPIEAREVIRLLSFSLASNNDGALGRKVWAEELAPAAA